MFSLEEQEKLLARLRCLGYVCNGDTIVIIFFKGPLSVKRHCILQKMLWRPRRTWLMFLSKRKQATSYMYPRH